TDTEISDTQDTDIPDTTEDVQNDTEPDVILADIQTDITTDTTEDTTSSDITSDIISDGGTGVTIIKDCPKSPNNLARLTFEFSNSDASTYECRLNNSDWTACTSPYELPNSTITDLPDGDNTFMVRAIINGNPEDAPAECRWIKDTIAPDTIFSSQPDFECRNYVLLEIEATEENCTFEYSLDDSDWTETTSPVDIRNLTEGGHTVKIRAKDKAGNTDNTPLQYRFTTDTIPPDTTIVSRPDSFIKTDTATFAFTSSDSSAVFMCSFDWSAFYECQSPQVFSNLTEQTHIFRIYSKDNCNNNSQIYEYTFTVDITPPQSTITAKPSPVSNNKNPSFSFICSEEATAECKLDSGTYTSCTSPKNYTQLQDGEHRFEVRCTDRAGNTDPTPDVYIWTIDTIAPETTLVTKPNNPSQFKNATFEFTCSETGTAECSLDNSPY
ncbi:MAG: hypothetical protein N3B13_11555, partial [Deltaproteobacteria bacterium]|nr:hypothetical protein [Deltaproteobacteria bacterium]